MDTLSTYEIHQSYAETEYGHQLAQQIRYDKYRALSGKTDTAEWVHMFGADVHNLKHLLLHRGLARNFIRQLDATQPGYLTNEDETLLELGATIHDWAEAVKAVGDTSYSDKTAADEAAEQYHFMANLEKFCPAASTETAALIYAAAQHVVFNKTSKPGRVFNAIERIGYMRTALRAEQHITLGTAPAVYTPGLRWLITDVLSNHTATLTEHASNLKPVTDFLVRQAAQIDNAFELIELSDVNNYAENERTKRQQMVDSNRTAWNAWVLKQALVSEI